MAVPEFEPHQNTRRLALSIPLRPKTRRNVLDHVYVSFYFPLVTWLSARAVDKGQGDAKPQKECLPQN